MTRITVAIRTRPTASFAKSIIKIQPDNKGVVVELPKQHADEYVNNQNSTFSWSFDAILHNAPQEAVYARIAAPTVADALKGINGTVLMYGQTGSGKTYTTIGDMGTFKYRGIVPRAIADVFAFIEAHPENEVAVSVSYLEIYNDALTDLLGALPASAVAAAGGGRMGAGSAGAYGGDLQICEDGKSGEISVKGLRVLPVRSEEAALSLLFEGESNRAVAQHELNKGSTRGHAVFSVHLTVRSRVESSARVLSAKLNLVDLAGSERLKKTDTAGERMAESMSINRSLSYLEQLVVALGSKSRGHLPYRQSKMTHLLKDAVGGNCKTALIACIYGEAAHIEETVSTLNFAARVMRVTNTVKVNVAQDQSQLLKRYEAEAKQLRQELAMHDALAGRSRVAYDPYTEVQQADLRERLRAWLDSGGAEPLQPDSARMMSEILAQMKLLWQGLKQEVAQRPASGAAAPAHGGAHDTPLATMEEGSGEGAGGEGAQPVGEYDLSKSTGVAVGRAPDGAAPEGGLELATTRRSFGGGGGGGGGRPVSPGESLFGGAREGSIGLGGGLGNASRLSDISNAMGGGVGSGGLDRNEAFAVYKEYSGAGKTADMRSAKAAQQRLRLALRGHAERVNRLKAEIGGANAELAAKRAERARIDERQALANGGSTFGGSFSASRGGTGTGGGDGGAEELIIDEEEYSFLKLLKGLKAEYREAYGAHAQAAAELNEATERADALRASLLSDFNDWFASGGGQPLDVFAPAQKERPPGTDMMDDDEAFQFLEQERVRNAEPDSLAFFNANKAMKKRGKTLRAI